MVSAPAAALSSENSVSAHASPSSSSESPKPTSTNSELSQDHSSIKTEPQLWSSSRDIDRNGERKRRCSNGYNPGIHDTAHSSTASPDESEGIKTTPSADKAQEASFRRFWIALVTVLKSVGHAILENGWTFLGFIGVQVVSVILAGLALGIAYKSLELARNSAGLAREQYELSKYVVANQFRKDCIEVNLTALNPLTEIFCKRVMRDGLIHPPTFSLGLQGVSEQKVTVTLAKRAGDSIGKLSGKAKQIFSDNIGEILYWLMMLLIAGMFLRAAIRQPVRKRRQRNPYVTIRRKKESEVRSAD